MIRQLLNITATPLRLNIHSPLGKYEITSPKASWEINRTKSELNVMSDPIKVKIDRRDMYASMGIYMPDKFRQKTEQESKQIVMETIGQLGDDWRSIGETQGATLVDICLRNSGWNPVELYQTWIPGERPNITWEGGTPTKVDFSQFKLDIQWMVPLKPNVEYHKEKTDVSVSQWHKVNIEYMGTTADIMKFGNESAKKLNIQI